MDPSFAASLSKRVASKRQETKDRELIAQKWTRHENKLLDQAVDLFKQRALKAAGGQNNQAIVSFEVLTRHIPNFPTYTATNGTYLMDSWGDAEPQWWYYAHRGTTEVWTPGVPVQFAELLEGMMPKFLEKVAGLGFESAGREPNSWRVRVTWKTPEPGREDDGSFATECSLRMRERSKEIREREVLAAKWVAHSDKLLEEALELFKQRCLRTASNMQCQAVVSFEVLTREVPNFPSYVVKDSTYLVDSWGDAPASWWFYATRGTTEAWTPGTPVQFAELLEGLMPRFLEKAKSLDFETCGREPSSWRVKVTWKTPSVELVYQERKRAMGEITNGAVSPPAPPMPRASEATAPRREAPATTQEPARKKARRGASESPSRTEVPSATEPAAQSDDEPAKNGKAVRPAAQDVEDVEEAEERQRSPTDPAGSDDDAAEAEDPPKQPAAAVEVEDERHRSPTDPAGSEDEAGKEDAPKQPASAAAEPEPEEVKSDTDQAASEDEAEAKDKATSPSAKPKKTVPEEVPSATEMASSDGEGQKEQS